MVANALKQKQIKFEDFGNGLRPPLLPPHSSGCKDELQPADWQLRGESQKFLRLIGFRVPIAMHQF